MNTGSVEFASYDSKNLVLNAHATNNSVLLLNDRFDPNWKVSVDGKPAPLLKCNYLMRGVYLETGDHKVEFKFLPPVRALYVSLAALAAAAVVLGVVLFVQPVGQSSRRPKVHVPASSPLPTPRSQSQTRPQ